MSPVGVVSKFVVEEQNSCGIPQGSFLTAFSCSGTNKAHTPWIGRFSSRHERSGFLL